MSKDTATIILAVCLVLAATTFVLGMAEFLTEWRAVRRERRKTPGHNNVVR